MVKKENNVYRRQSEDEVEEEVDLDSGEQGRGDWEVDGAVERPGEGEGA
jgi:hypothetical protein